MSKNVVQREGAITDRFCKYAVYWFLYIYNQIWLVTLGMVQETISGSGRSGLAGRGCDGAGDRRSG